MSGAVLSLIGAAGGGGSAVTITIDPQFLYTYNALGASVAYQLNLNGIAYYTLNGGAAVSLGNWCTPTAQAANYECYATLVSGTLFSGTTGSWLALTSTRIWSVVSSPGNNELTVVNIGVRRVGDTTILASADIELNADSS